MRSLIILVSGGLAALLLGACSSSAATPLPNPSAMASTASTCVPGNNLTQTVQTAHYLMVLDLGPTETMYTQAQVDASHPTSGEVMISGQMADMSSPGPSAMAMGSATAEPMASAMGSMASPNASMVASPSATAPGAAMTGSMGTDTRHLEVHICSLMDGTVVQGAQPTITVVDATAGGMSTQVPIAVMEGIGAAAADYHYGNNVNMPAGRTYSVVVTLNGDSATFNLANTP